MIAKTKSLKAIGKSLLDVLLYSILLFTVALITYGVRLGFDTSDEAWVLSLVDSRRITYAEPWAYHYVLHPLWTFVGEKVIVFRLIRVLGYLASALFLAYSGEKFLKAYFPVFRINSYRPFLTLFSILGASWAWIWAPQTLGYNEVSGCLGVLVAGTFLLLAAVDSDGKRSRHLVAMGFLITLIAPFKYPSAFALSAIVFLGILSLNGLRKNRLLGLLQVGLGGMTGIIVLVLIDLPFRNWIGTIKRLFTDEKLQALFGHPIAELLRTNIFDLLSGLRMTAFISLIPLLILLVSVVKISNKDKKKSLLVTCLGILLSGFTVYFFFDLLVLPNLEWHYWVLKSVSGFVGITGLVIYLFVISRYVSSEKRRDSSVVALFLFATPLTLAFGTNNPILGQVNYSMAPWFWMYAAALVLLVTRYPGAVTRLVFVTYASLAIASTIAMVYFGVLVSPYRGSKFQENTTSSNVPALSGILMSPDLASELDWVSKVGATPEFANRDVIAINSPGLLFTFNNSDFASPFIFDGWLISYVSVKHACEVSGKAPLILKDASIKFPDSLLPALHECGVTSMDQYELLKEHVGNSQVPDAQIWEFKN